MNRYSQEQISPEKEPVKPHVAETFTDTLLPTDDEVRYLGNAWNYCGYFHKELKDCVEDGVVKGDQYLFKKCKNKVEELHHCYSWREPTEQDLSANTFTKETQKCLYPRELFLKCYFKQAESWESCHPAWSNLYSCQFRSNPKAYTIF
ncbi:unnamed protein product [Blepharisma stoltei]|uniref:Uncharacterized protein n=1 Tax=Blepharisma stoltei TaxID=1481888 RepID=A0AAU9J647_9CILI|nr:unnamed protein product [Blepharisma stoltei]